MADQNLSIEISAKDLTGPAFASVVKNIEDMAGASRDTAKGVAELGGSAEKAAGFFKGAGLAAAITLAYNELSKYHAETRRSVAALADQADQLNLTTNRWQALVFAGDQVGVSQEKLAATMSRFSARIGEAAGGSKGAIEAFDKLGVKLLDNEGQLRGQPQILQEVAQGILRMGNADEQAAAAKDLLGITGARMVPLLRQLADGMGEVERRAQAAGVVIDKDVVEAANRLENQSHATSMAIRKFYAEIGLPIEVSALKLVETIVGGIADAYRKAQMAQKDFVAGIAVAGRASAIGALEEKRATLEKQLANPPRFMQGGQATMRQQIAEIDARIAELRGSQAKWQDYRQGLGKGTDGTLDFLMNDGLPAKDGGAQQPKVKSGGGGSARDRTGEALNQIVAERQAAERALAQFAAGAGMPLKDLERQVELEKKIADEVAKLGKYDPKDPRVAQIREEVTARENAEAALKRWQVAARDADTIERQSGDGRAFLRAETERLNQALDTGRLSYDAYAVSMKAARDKAEDMRLQLEGQKGGVEGLAAGMEYAARQWQRNNTTFAQGQQIFNASVNSMEQALNEFVSTGELNFQKLLGSFAMMIAQMELRAAASSIWGALGGAGGGGGGLGGIFSGGISNLLGGGSWGSAAAGVGSTVPDFIAAGGFAFAEGGSPPVGVPSLVGERGPELFVPKSAGTIISNEQLRGMGGGSSVIVQQTNHFGSDISRAEFDMRAQEIERRTTKAAIAGVLEEKRSSSGYRRGLRG